MIDLGQGAPVVLIPGIQGRWEWMRPTVKALGRRCRAISFSICGEPGAGSIDPALGFDNFVVQIDAALDRAGLSAAALCGISYGGLIALHYAALRPQRTSALILVSTPSPRWTPDPRVRQYLRAPRLLSPLFIARSPGRLWPEISAALPAWQKRLDFSIRHVARIAAAPLSPTRMCQRVALATEIDFVRDCERVTAPTLVVTGEDRLDRVIPASGTREYVGAIAGARGAVLSRTGHIGLLTQPERFADLVTEFVGANTGAAAERRRRA